VSGEPSSPIVRVDRISSRGKHFRIEANEAERRAIAEALDIVDVAALSAELDVRSLAGDSVEVRGALMAQVAQTDVVTLEPVRQDIAEEIEVTLAPAEESGRRRHKRESDAEPEAERDLYHKGQIDLGAIAVEHLALGLDPYPRAPDAEFPGHVEDAADPEESPFAALKRLKHDQE
jgi:Large ribosomal RNA subunit accumulation protein YceD